MLSDTCLSLNFLGVFNCCYMFRNITICALTTICDIWVLVLYNCFITQLLTAAVVEINLLQNLIYIHTYCSARLSVIGLVCRACSSTNGYDNKHSHTYNDHAKQLPIELSTRHYISHDDLLPQPVFSDLPRHLPSNPDDCRMDNCFDFSKCTKGFKVYIYPMPLDTKRCESYQRILNVIKNSEFYTTNAEEACLFISGVDTVDQDKLSDDYIPNLQAQLHSLPYWNKGINHLIFNIYSGTWPDYSEKIGVGIGYAMLAKASISTHYFRAGFDISLPLFHKTLPEYVGEEGRLNNLNIPPNRPLLLAFKGKRYLSGIGSESRNQLYHIHNGKDIIMLTTCKHGKGWEKLADSRCSIDNEMYERLV